MTFSNNSGGRGHGFRLALFSVLFAFLVLGLGAFTRLVDAGLGCPDWPGCYGHALWPSEHHEIQAANDAFPHAPVEVDKTWPEMVHRYLAASLGLLTIALVFLSLRHRDEGQPLKLPLFIFCFILLQGAFGMWTVTLKLWPQVVTAHLLGGFTMLSLLWLLSLRLSHSPWRFPLPDWRVVTALRPLAAVAMLVVIAQIFLGGWTTSNYADIACPDLPTCQRQWLPPMNFADGFNLLQHIGPNYLGGNLSNEARVAIHFSHRIGAMVVTIVLLLLVWRLWRLKLPQTRRMSQVIGGVLLLQLALGVSNVLFSFPVGVAVAHNLVGALLLLTMVTLNYRVWTARIIAADIQ